VIAPAPLLALLASASSTVTTLGGDPALAKSDPSNTTGLLVGIITTLVIAVGALVLYLRNRKRVPD
jgi:hypothetical protein